MQGTADAGKDVDKGKDSCIAGENTNWNNWKPIWRIVRKLEIVIPEDQAVPFL